MTKEVAVAKSRLVPIAMFGFLWIILMILLPVGAKMMYEPNGISVGFIFAYVLPSIAVLIMALTNFLIIKKLLPQISTLMSSPAS